MRVSRKQSEENKQTVISTAGCLFREKGFDGIGLSDLMKAAGLTHGGFYKKFESKEDLQRQSVSKAFSEVRARLTNKAMTSKKDPFDTFLNSYLSKDHRNNISEGCPFAALSVDATRQNDQALRNIFATEARAYSELIESILTAEPDPSSHSKSLAVLSTIVGGLLMSRAVKDTQLSDEFLDASHMAAQQIAKEHF